MSVISVSVVGQALHITDNPLIAAYGVNENYINFTFDSSWNGFGKRAVFYHERDEETVYQTVVDENGLAVIPHEVTDDSGAIWFGVCGVKDDVVFTSEILSYKVFEGAFPNGRESVPATPGMYEQMLTIVGQIQQEVDDFKGDISDQLSALEGATSANIEAFKKEVKLQSGRVVLFSGTGADGHKDSYGTGFKQFDFTDGHKLNEFDKVVIYIRNWGSGSNCTEQTLTLGAVSRIPYKLIQGTSDAPSSSIIILEGIRNLYNSGARTTFLYKAVTCYTENGVDKVLKDEDILSLTILAGAGSCILLNLTHDAVLEIVGYASGTNIGSTSNSGAYIDPDTKVLYL